MDYLKYLIDAQKSGVAALMSFTLSYRDFENVIACFVEGKDACYYRSRVMKHVDSAKEIIFYPCNGKAEVIFVRNSLKLNLQPTENVKVLYFCDRDYDLDLKCDDIFYTDFYSVENYYCTKSFVENVLVNVFNFNRYNPNYYLALKLFDEKFSIFYDEIIKVNSFAYSCRINERKNGLSRKDFNSVSFLKFVEDDSFDTFKMQSLNYNNLVHIFNVDYVTEDDYLNNLTQINDSKIRGKWFLKFIIWFLEGIKIELKNGTNGFIKCNSRIISFEDSVMTSMEQYAYTSSTLINYIIENS